jgi:uncharacterized protein
MKRDLFYQLEAWKTHPLRKPLIVRGARQVGKSWTVESFGKQFDHFICINFEKQISAKQLFHGDVNVKQLLERLAVFTGKSILPNKTLLFLDEIQECPEAINYLRYFKEDFPELHVIAAGSLLDFELDKIGIPVGRVQFMYLHPLSFLEFLSATDNAGLREAIEKKKIDAVLHQKVLELLRTYLWLGGMPAVVHAWIHHGKVEYCQELQDEILQAYQQDFHKYAKHNQIENVAKVFASVPHQLGNKFKYVHVDSELRSALLKQALFLLEKACIVHICYHSSAQEQPLGATRNEKKFKVYFFDIGLAQRMLGLIDEAWLISPVTMRNLGKVAEQLVAQEFVAYSSVKSAPELYYWHRESRSSNAEIDLVVTKKTDIVPIEIKSGKQGSMKSMYVFLDSHPRTRYGLKISDGLYARYENIQEIPLYGLKQWLDE